nr:unnamed protein product [Callosobruchus analis]
MDVNQSFKFFIDSLIWSYNIICPLKITTKTISEQRTINPANEWINEAILGQGRYLKGLYWLMTQHPTETTQQTYRIEKQRYRKNIEDTKKRYYSNKIDTAINKSKEI